MIVLLDFDDLVCWKQGDKWLGAPLINQDADLGIVWAGWGDLVFQIDHDRLHPRNEVFGAFKSQLLETASNLFLHPFDSREAIIEAFRPYLRK